MGWCKGQAVFFILQEMGSSEITLGPIIRFIKNKCIFNVFVTEVGSNKKKYQLKKYLYLVCVMSKVGIKIFHRLGLWKLCVIKIEETREIYRQIYIPSIDKLYKMYKLYMNKCIIHEINKTLKIKYWIQISN